MRLNSKAAASGGVPVLSGLVSLSEESSRLSGAGNQVAKKTHGVFG